MGDVLPLGASGLVEVNVRIDATGEDMQIGGIDVFGVGVEVGTDLGDTSIDDGDVCARDSSRCDHSAATDDHSLASSSMKRPSTSIATATSSVSTDSAGLWLMPPLQRTKSIPMSVISDM